MTSPGSTPRGLLSASERTAPVDLVLEMPRSAGAWAEASSAATAERRAARAAQRIAAAYRGRLPIMESESVRDFHGLSGILRTRDVFPWK
jgi:hypothetical protein